MIVVTDVDGVLTDGGMYYTEAGKIMKKFNPGDHDGVRYLRDNIPDVRIQAITADKRGFNITDRRMKEMHIPLSIVSEEDRLPYLQQYKADAFIGDGFHDVECIRAVEFGRCPPGSIASAFLYGRHVLRTNGVQHSYFFFFARELVSYFKSEM